MKTYHKLFATLLFLTFSSPLLAQFETTKYQNVITFNVNEEIRSKFSTSIKLWTFKPINDNFLVVTPCKLVDANYYSFAVYENYKFKGAYSFGYNINTAALAHYKNDIFFATTRVGKVGSVLCKFNLNTQEESYIYLPTSLIEFFNKEDLIKHFSFDQTTSKVYFFIYRSLDDNNYVFSYNLKSGEFSDKTAIKRIDNHLFTVNSYHYFNEDNERFYSLKIDDPKAKPKKLSLKVSDRQTIISDDEVVYYNRGVGEKTIFTVVKNGEVYNQNKQHYEGIVNSLRNDFFGGGESLDTRFCFNYSAPGKYDELKTSKGFYKTMEPILKPGLFLAVYYSPSDNNTATVNRKSRPKPANSTNTAAETKTDPEDKYYKNVIVYKGVSDAELVVEVEAEALYKVKKSPGLLSFTYIDVKEAKGIRFRYPGNSSTWYQFGSGEGAIYSCKYGFNCISIKGMVFKLASPYIR